MTDRRHVTINGTTYAIETGVAGYFEMCVGGISWMDNNTDMYDAVIAMMDRIDELEGPMPKNKELAEVFKAIDKNITE